MTALKAAIDRDRAMQLAATEYQRCAELLSSLDASDWTTPTECPGWDVRQMAAHMLGMVEMAASMREGMRQNKAAMVDGRFDIDELTALQVRERADWSGRADRRSVRRSAGRPRSRDAAARRGSSAAARCRRWS